MYARIAGFSVMTVSLGPMLRGSDEAGVPAAVTFSAGT